MIAVVILAVFCQVAAAGATRASSGSPARVVARLERGLAGSPMAGTGRILESQGRRRHVSPFFMAGVAAVESSLGRSSCYGNPRNVWGLGSCSQGWRVPYFATWRAAIRYYARFLAERWPRHSSPWSFGGYAANLETWAAHVAYQMRALFGVGPSTRYP